ncbi:MAG TPA: TadE/TadG family type IV pilus assembly protein [Terracidiphilus sp.]|nr:TadE/TadG family type IV pilus assembly protein [Terracidiphilus sp.]
MKLEKRIHLLRDERGASLVEMAALLPLFLLLLFGAIDFGRAYYLTIEVAGAAHAAAAYGAQNPTDVTGMRNAANNDAPGVTLTFANSTPSYGCECSDGTSYSASCSTAPSCSGTTEVYRVNVTVSATYSPLFPWPRVPSSMSFTSTASMRSAGS